MSGSSGWFGLGRLSNTVGYGMERIRQAITVAQDDETDDDTDSSFHSTNGASQWELSALEDVPILPDATEELYNNALMEETGNLYGVRCPYVNLGTDNSIVGEGGFGMYGHHDDTSGISRRDNNDAALTSFQQNTAHRVPVLDTLTNQQPANTNTGILFGTEATEIATIAGPSLEGAINRVSPPTVGHTDDVMAVFYRQMRESAHQSQTVLPRQSTNGFLSVRNRRLETPLPLPLSGDLENQDFALRGTEERPVESESSPPRNFDPLLSLGNTNTSNALRLHLQRLQLENYVRARRDRSEHRNQNSGDQRENIFSRIARRTSLRSALQRIPQLATVNSTSEETQPLALRTQNRTTGLGIVDNFRRIIESANTTASSRDCALPEFLSSDLHSNSDGRRIRRTWRRNSSPLSPLPHPNLFHNDNSYAEVDQVDSFQTSRMGQQNFIGWGDSSTFSEDRMLSAIENWGRLMAILTSHNEARFNLSERRNELNRRDDELPLRTLRKCTILFTYNKKTPADNNKLPQRMEKPVEQEREEKNKEDLLELRRLIFSHQSSHFPTMEREEREECQAKKKPSKKEAKSDQESCSICWMEYEPLDILRKLKMCSHIFHADCVDQWFETRSTCPVCRHKLTVAIEAGSNNVGC